jgi:hypothetical protein
VAIALLNVYDAYNQAVSAVVNPYEFNWHPARFCQKHYKFVAAGQTFNVNYGEGQITILTRDGAEFPRSPIIIVNPLDQSLFLTVDFKSAVREAIDNRETSFNYMMRMYRRRIHHQSLNTVNVKRETSLS